MPDEATTLGELLIALDHTVATLVDAPAGESVPLRAVALAEPADLRDQLDADGPLPEVYLLVGDDTEATLRWLHGLAGRTPAQRPRVLMTKSANDSPAVRAAAHAAGIALVHVHRQARWDQVFGLVRRMLARSPGQRAAAGEHDLLAPDTDLFGLAQVVARETGGMVSIEDPHSHVLAYSASDAAADRLRIQSILGREGPADYLRILREWGVFDRVRRSDEVVDVPEHPELDIRRRLVVGIRRGDPARMLGTIWLQQGDRPLRPDAAQVLRGASAVAARIIARGLDAPSTEALLVRRLFGAHGDGVDVPSVAAALNLPTTGPAAVIGFARVGPDPGPVPSSGLIRLHASAFRDDSVTEAIGDRVYVLLPSYHSERGVGSWARELVAQLEQARGLLVRAAVAAPVAGLTAVAGARAEVDRVLDSPAAASGSRVATLAEARTAVLLAEIVDLVRARPDLHDPRLAALDAYDREHSAQLRVSVREYLRVHGEVSVAAAALRVHPNTLRYRLRRVETVLGIDLGDPADRLLLELQLAAIPIAQP
ncbi:PucR family transcriptional regulator [Nocardia asteroides NBRC 15531]|uniref:CdaR family transcriptional regulator n=1 Tax=Nocardia asteroides NBRC 15531 TaxID=1110697 RepID=U5EJR3_NOCAS|nr:helix-turn-helix domain-containing protein [Nocardia asteroides]TLF66928.1 PucR family transcriptional regulator [Nocardia asteroides NBRC 15531]UGT51821.1 helix-turn-helix domain-containing protein [Nocardia asteroides]SFM16092.1 PucR C-terminal helix-turn-helix domain-containing protein [Nocardia asteroides]VEG35267.1 carbohydrate diacid transcriptional activator CdaR [Nocardia asteroides]GAD86578.1 putative CdaR family transcriptional regulator [Nocardia asteroides NBRC 15531]